MLLTPDGQRVGGGLKNWSQNQKFGMTLVPTERRREGYCKFGE